MQDPTKKHATEGGGGSWDKYNYKKQIKRYNIVSQDIENILQCVYWGLLNNTSNHIEERKYKIAQNSTLTNQHGAKTASMSQYKEETGIARKTPRNLRDPRGVRLSPLR